MCYIYSLELNYMTDTMLNKLKTFKNSYTCTSLFTAANHMI